MKDKQIDFIKINGTEILPKIKFTDSQVSVKKLPGSGYMSVYRYDAKTDIGNVGCIMSHPPLKDMKQIRKEKLETFQRFYDQYRITPPVLHNEGDTKKDVVSRYRMYIQELLKKLEY